MHPFRGTLDTAALQLRGYFSAIDDSMIHEGGLALLSSIGKPAIYNDVYLMSNNALSRTG